MLVSALGGKLWGSVRFLNWIGDLTLSLLLKQPSRKLELWYVPWSFLLLRLCCLYKSTMRPCMEYFCHVWAGAPSCYLELLDKLQKRICRTVGTSLTASRKPLSHCRNLASLSLFCSYYFDRCSSKLAQLVPLFYSWGRSRHSDRFHDFSVTIPRCYKDVYVSVQWSLLQLHMNK